MQALLENILTAVVIFLLFRARFLDAVGADRRAQVATRSITMIVSIHGTKNCGTMSLQHMERESVP